MSETKPKLTGLCLNRTGNLVFDSSVFSLWRVSRGSDWWFGWKLSERGDGVSAAFTCLFTCSCRIGCLAYFRLQVLQPRESETGQQRWRREGKQFRLQGGTAAGIGSGCMNISPRREEMWGKVSSQFHLSVEATCFQMYQASQLLSPAAFSVHIKYPLSDCQFCHQTFWCLFTVANYGSFCALFRWEPIADPPSSDK